MASVSLDDISLGALFPDLAARIVSTFEGLSSGIGSAGGGRSDFSAYIADAASRYDVPAGLVQAVIQTESNFNPHAVSSAGAKGLMQLMDSTAQTFGVSNSFDPRQNIEGGVRYLHELLQRYGNVPLALAAYNAGSAAVDTYGGVPPYAETQAYVQRVLSLCKGWDA
jgi:soluble lytic murein transglycosylase-like protein